MACLLKPLTVQGPSRPQEKTPAQLRTLQTWNFLIFHFSANNFSLHGSESGSVNPFESGSNPYPDPKHWFWYAKGRNPGKIMLRQDRIRETKIVGFDRVRITSIQYLTVSNRRLKYKDSYKEKHTFHNPYLSNLFLLAAKGTLLFSSFYCLRMRILQVRKKNYFS
jgi:hypothetical protein